MSYFRVRYRGSNVRKNFLMLMNIRPFLGLKMSNKSEISLMAMLF